MVKKVTKRIRLFDGLDLDPAQKSLLKQEIGEFLVKEMQSYLDEGKSPVTGGKFQKLSKTYAKEKGSSNPNLFLSGDMRSQISYEEFRDGIEIGIFNEDEAQKADNHNKNSAKSKMTKVPMRQFIPYESSGVRGSFHKPIRDKMQDLIDKIIGK